MDQQVAIRRQIIKEEQNLFGELWEHLHSENISGSGGSPSITFSDPMPNFQVSASFFFFCRPKGGFPTFNGNNP